MSSATDIPLILFAKVPIPGRVKTRLQSHCSAQQAADIAKLLLRISLDQVQTHWPGRVILGLWPHCEDPTLAGIPSRILRWSQPPGDLGEKMQAALETFGYPAAILGCDVPHTDASILQTAHKNLARGQNTLGPSHDGGYYLIGLAKRNPSLFKDMPWGTSAILEKTLALDTFQKLDALRDIDAWDDLIATHALLPEVSDYLQNQDLI